MPPKNNYYSDYFIPKFELKKEKKDMREDYIATVAYGISFDRQLENIREILSVKPAYSYPKVDKIIYNLKGKTTVVYWKDGDKTVVKCSENEEFTKEGGLSACFMKKMFDSRGEFLRLVESGFVQE